MAVRSIGLAVAGAVLTASDVNLRPSGWLGYVEKTANQTITGGTEADVSGLSLTVTLPANRRIRVTAAGGVNPLTSGGVAVAYIKEGSTYLRAVQTAASTSAYGEKSVVLTPSAGAHTYVVRVVRISGAGDVRFDADAAGNLAFLLVEDMGDAS